jgi:CrcB protein
MMMLLWIALGGALGAVARYGLGGWVHAWTGTRFPWGTLAVNLLGSLLIGFLVRYLEGVAVSTEIRGFATIGLLGAFTTFSTYTYETVALMRDGEWRQASLYSLGSLGLGITAVYVGIALAGHLLQAKGVT